MEVVTILAQVATEESGVGLWLWIGYVGLTFLMMYVDPQAYGFRKGGRE